ncbi:SAC3 family protein B-like isoform X2 [Ananas comosus]|nr:SAC3 family protein B-like isoform X2 [Ananas comosus]
MRSPPTTFNSNQLIPNLNLTREAQKPDVTLRNLDNQKQSPIGSHSLPHQKFHTFEPSSDTHNKATLSPPKPVYTNAAKRARSPPLLVPEALQKPLVQLDSDREELAKAKRLARFNVELSRPIEKMGDFSKQNTSSYRQNHASLAEHNALEPAEEANRSSVSDIEVSESSPVVVGLCPDMCPESEREERERKGDLDRYERLDGERNQTTKYLAVKKYTRTAERETSLIRPLPVLQITVDYLLNLLDQPYDDSFLSIYNFLWDRMRAVRLDLRMQHIFNQEAITMLEQMIRLHIIAMHELCEYNKGEGFSEGFDAHLNIEQMNKTSVELFQMYTDHRKKGIVVPTEKEFRGYYALLKLDRHPGYKVEPGELSLDLTKMSPEIRNSPEISFAREVSRACRFGNYIAFFRLARKATYLQACLMHAHFTKVRTQALASLHSSLQNNQGIPITHVVNWLGMEGEDLECLLEYHGFALKKYEELYMVKEGPFLNQDADFPTKCSQLVQLKKSQRIIGDVYSGPTMSALTGERVIHSDMTLEVADEKGVASEAEVMNDLIDEPMVDNQAYNQVHPKSRTLPQAQELLEEEIPLARVSTEEVGTVKEVTFPLPVSSSVSKESSISSYPQQNADDEVIEASTDTSMDQMILMNTEVNLVEAGVPGIQNSNCNLENTNDQMDIGENLSKEAPALVVHQENVARQKLKLILRRWMRRAVQKRLRREENKILAIAALNSLTVGPPLRPLGAAPKHACEVLNIDKALKERYLKQEKSLSRLNISELVAPILSERTPGMKCFCWKLLILIPPSQSRIVKSAFGWCLSKLMGHGREDNERLVSLPHLSIWKKWLGCQKNSPEICCLSVVRGLDSEQEVFENDSIDGTSSLIYLISECIPWDFQRNQLHKLVRSIPSGSKLPLLIASFDTYGEEKDLVSQTVYDRLSLISVDKSKISSLSIVFLAGNIPKGFFDDDELRSGLKWLAYHSPLQPALSLVDTRELVMSYLRFPLNILENSDASQVGPDQCISAFNDALNRLIGQVHFAASVNSNGWPCPEIDLLEKSTSERKVVETFLPSIGWSSPSRIESLAKAIVCCKLPEFHYDLSWLSHGSHMGKQILNQKSALEECLVNYLTRTSQLLNAQLATSEARVMVQTGVGLELRGSSYYIVPRWVDIFRRIFNWSMTRLVSRECSLAYILEEHLNKVSTEIDAITSWEIKTSSFESHRRLNPVRFDELVEACCSLPTVEKPVSVPRAECFPSRGVVHEESNNASKGIVHGEVNTERHGNISSDDSGSLFGTREKESVVASLFKNSNYLDSFNRLFERCKQVQDTIDKKLAFYL